MTEPAPHMTPDEFRRLGHAMVERIAAYAEHLADLPVTSRVTPGDIAALLPARAPERPDDWDAILADIDRIVMPGLTHWQHPSFFGYFPANGSFPALLGDMLSTGLAVQGMLWQTSPACTEIETRILDWLGHMIGLPDPFLADASGASGGGVIHGTASEATLSALAAARTRHPGMTTHHVIYTSSQAHSSVVKAAMIAGLGRDAVRLIDVDDELRLRPELLQLEMEADRNAGRTPAFVVATLGTTSTTAVDPLRAIGEIARAHNAWLHVDAAYAGAACVCPEHRWILDGVELADSFNFNPHKWLLTNFDCSAFWTRDRAALINAMSITPEYLRNAASDSGAVIDYRDWHVPLGRRFRALKLWFVIRHYGVEGLQAHIRHHVNLAARFEEALGADPRFQLIQPRHFSLVCFRLKDSDEANMQLMERLNASGGLFLTHTRIPRPHGGDHIVLRLAIGAVQTDAAAVDAAFTLIQRAADAVREHT